MKRLLCTFSIAGCFSTPVRPSDTGIADANGDAGELPVNFMFVTRDRYTGNQITNAGAADAFCAGAVAQTSLPGTYRAWVAFLNMPATSRLGGARGWRRPDGEPFAASVDDIVNGVMYAPPRIDQFGNDVFSEFEYVLTGATGAGVPSGMDCSSGSKVTVGTNDADRPLWTELAALDCSTDFHLYCFGVDRENSLVVQKRTPLAFLSSPVSVGTGPDILDDTCKTDAAGHVSGTFHAAVATTAQSALERVSLGQTRTWYRIDGTVVATSSGAEFLAPLDIMADGTRAASDVFVRAPRPNTLADSSNNCADWSLTTGMTSTGDSRRSSTGAFAGSSNVNCSTTQRVYCFQID